MKIMKLFGKSFNPNEKTYFFKTSPLFDSKAIEKVRQEKALLSPTSPWKRAIKWKCNIKLSL